MSDLISRQRAIDEISRWLGYLDDDMILRIQIGLRKLPSAQPVATDTNVGDTISRQAAIDALDCINGAEEVLRSLPTAQPERKTGRWILYDKRFPWMQDYKCSECGNYLDFSGVNAGRGSANFCPNCGADMRGEQE